MNVKVERETQLVGTIKIQEDTNENGEFLIIVAVCKNMIINSTFLSDIY